MRRATSIAVVLLALWASGCRGLLPEKRPARIVRGPLPGRIHQPQALTYLSQTPRRARLQPNGTLGVGVTSTYGNIHEIGNGPNVNVNIDGEFWTNTLILRQGLRPRVDLEVQVPTLYTTSGFLDTFIQDFHTGFLLPNGGRASEPDNQFGMDITVDGNRIATMEEDRFGLLDIPIFLTFALGAEAASGSSAGAAPGSALALRVGVGLPTGSEEAGFGNGTVDWGLGFLGEASRGRWTGHGALTYTVNGDPPGFEGSGASAADPWEAVAAAEMRWTDQLSLLTQLAWSSRLVDGIQLKEVDRNILDLGVGFAFGSDGTQWTLSFHEDLVAESAHDFYVLLGWSRGM